MRARLVISVLGAALAVGGCGSGNERASQGRVVVPDLKGKTLRDATCGLQQLGLRWRSRGTRGISPPVNCGVGNGGGSMDDIPVTGQTPQPGSRVRPGSVVTLDDLCTDAARKRQGGCL